MVKKVGSKKVMCCTASPHTSFRKSNKVEEKSHAVSMGVGTMKPTTNMVPSSYYGTARYSNGVCPGLYYGTHHNPLVPTDRPRAKVHVGQF